MRLIGLAMALALACTAAAAQDSALIFTTVQANGQSGLFLVDTGAPATVLDTAFARRAGARLGADHVLKGGGGAMAGRIAEDVAVRAQGGPELRLDAAATDLGGVARAFGHPLDGILGADYFGTLAVTLDYRTGAARFEDPRSALPPPSAEPLMILSAPYVRAVAEAGGRKVEGLYQIDTGSNLAVAFWSPYARRVLPELPGVPAAGVGLAGAARSRLARLDAFTLAGTRREGLTVDVANDLHPDDAGASYAGAIGGALFAGRVLHLDYARQKMWLD